MIYISQKNLHIVLFALAASKKIDRFNQRKMLLYRRKTFTGNRLQAIRKRRSLVGVRQLAMYSYQLIRCEPIPAVNAMMKMDIAAFLFLLRRSKQMEEPNGVGQAMTYNWPPFVLPAS